MESADRCDAQAVKQASQENVLPHLEGMKPATVLGSIHEIEKYDRMARRNYGLSDGQAPGGMLSLNILTNSAAVQIVGKQAY